MVFQMKTNGGQTIQFDADVLENGEDSHAHQHCPSEAPVEDVDNGEECENVED